MHAHNNNNKTIIVNNFYSRGKDEFPTSIERGKRSNKTQETNTGWWGTTCIYDQKGHLLYCYLWSCCTKRTAYLTTIELRILGENSLTRKTGFLMGGLILTSIFNCYISLYSLETPFPPLGMTLQTSKHEPSVCLQFKTKLVKSRLLII